MTLGWRFLWNKDFRLCSYRKMVTFQVCYEIFPCSFARDRTFSLTSGGKNNTKVAKVCESALMKWQKNKNQPSPLIRCDVKPDWGDSHALSNWWENAVGDLKKKKKINYWYKSTSSSVDLKRYTARKIQIGRLRLRAGEQNLKKDRSDEGSCENCARFENVQTCNGAQRAGRALRAQLVQQNRPGPRNVLTRGWFRVQLEHGLARDDDYLT